MRVRGYGTEPGCAADLVVLDAEDMHEALRLQADRRWMIRRGRIVAETSVTSTINRGNDQPPGG
jgi:cytosine deaminase